MDSLSFCYWLQGFFEINASGDHPFRGLDEKQMRVIQDHLKLVFTKVTPDRSKENSEQLKDGSAGVLPPIYPYLNAPYVHIPNTIPGPPFTVTCSSVGSKLASTSVNSYSIPGKERLVIHPDCQKPNSNPTERSNSAGGKL